MGTLNSSTVRRIPWNKGRLTGQKPPLKLREIWAIRTRLQMSSNVRELALFNLAIDSKLRACDLTRLQVQDVCMGGHVVSRATSMQQKTQRPVQFEVTEQTRQSVAAWISARGLKPTDYLFPSRLHIAAFVDAPIFAHRPDRSKMPWCDASCEYRMQHHRARSTRPSGAAVFGLFICQ